MDDADVASDKAQKYNDAAIDSIRKQAVKLAATGNCYYCDADMEPNSNKVFCDLDCRNDYDKEKRIKERLGFRN